MTLELHVIRDQCGLEPHRGPWLDLVRRSRLAAALALRSEGRLMLWVRGTNPDAQRYSPGSVFDLVACRYAVADRARVLDYGTGLETYKFWCGATDAPVYTFRFAPT